MKFVVAILTSIIFTNFYAQSTDWTITGITDSVISVSGINEMIWTATQNNGVQSFNKSTGEITIYNIDNGNFDINDFRVIQCLNNKIYAGTYNSGIYIYDDENWIRYDTINSPLPGNTVSDIEFDPITNNVYFATDKGLAVLNNTTWTIYDLLNSPLPGNKLTCLYLDSSNRLWIGTRYGGLAKYIDEAWEVYNYDNSGLNDNYIRTITEDSAGILYIADYFGVDKYDPENDIWLFVYNTFTSGLSTNQVNKMGFDKTGNFWFATHHGTTKADIDGSWIQYYSENSNLPHNTCDGLFIDDNDNVWVGTYGGLAVINHNLLNITSYEPELNVFPSPARYDLAIQINSSYLSVQNISIFDALGKSFYFIASESFYLGEINFITDISHLPEGIYFVKVAFENTTLFKPFIKY